MLDTQTTNTTTTTTTTATTMASSDNTLVFYDIILDPAAYPNGPNPWKTRFALNFSKVPYRTAWTPLNAIRSTRDSLNLAVSRKHQDGSDFPTLPAIRDPRPGGGEAVVGDSFDIARHLQDTYLASAPASAQLFPASGDAAAAAATVALHRAFNILVDQVFSDHGAALAGFYMRFDPRTAAADKAAMMARMPGELKNLDWEDLRVAEGSEQREGMLRGFEAALDAKLAPCFPGGDGPFMGGRAGPMYADFIVGGWLQFMRGCLPDPEWDALRNRWSGGRWGKLFDALQQWNAVDGREGVAPRRP
ncbi:hypothetical protein RB597_000092 [Gaeumannomyces tritici]